MTKDVPIEEMDSVANRAKDVCDTLEEMHPSWDFVLITFSKSNPDLVGMCHTMEMTHENAKKYVSAVLSAETKEEKENA